MARRNALAVDQGTANDNSARREPLLRGVPDARLRDWRPGADLDKASATAWRDALLSAYGPTGGRLHRAAVERLIIAFVKASELDRVLLAERLLERAWNAPARTRDQLEARETALRTALEASYTAAARAGLDDSDRPMSQAELWYLRNRRPGPTLRNGPLLMPCHAVRGGGGGVGRRGGGYG